MCKKIISLIFVFVILLSGCGRTDIIGDNLPVSRDGFYFDTLINIKIYGETEEIANKALDNCFQIASKYENMFNKNIPDSEISKINSNSPNPTKVSEDTIYVINEAIKYSKLSNGLFDITAGNLISLWDFTEGNKIPDKDTLNNAASLVDFNKLTVTGNTVALSDSNIAIDLGSVAKGFITDKMKESLVNDGIESAIINLGGNVYILGDKPDGREFTVGIQDPKKEDGTQAFTVSVNDMSVVTSGTYQRYIEYDGVRYHHILDLNTGMPVFNGLTSVTIISPVSLDCDALSTTCFCLGYEKALELIESINDTEAVFIFEDGSIKFSSGMGEKIPYELSI